MTCRCRWFENELCRAFHWFKHCLLRHSSAVSTPSLISCLSPLKYQQPCSTFLAATSHLRKNIQIPASSIPSVPQCSSYSSICLGPGNCHAVTRIRYPMRALMDRQNQRSIITPCPADKAPVRGPVAAEDSLSETDDSFSGNLDHFGFDRHNSVPRDDVSRPECNPSRITSNRPRGAPVLRKGIARPLSKTRQVQRTKRDPDITTSVRGACGVQKWGITKGPHTTEKQAAVNLKVDTITTKSAKGIRLTDWRFREGTSGTDEMYLIDIEFKRPGESVANWMTEEQACREFRSVLLKF